LKLPAESQFRNENENSVIGKISDFIHCRCFISIKKETTAASMHWSANGEKNAGVAII